MDGVERWRVLRLHVEDEIPFAELAPERTAKNWPFCSGVYFLWPANTDFSSIV
jgi:hypothetical protein